MNERGNENQVAVFIDFENIQRSVQKYFAGANGNGPAEPGLARVDLTRILDEVARRYGRIVIKRAYADWHRYNEYRRDLMENAIEPVHVFSTEYKNRADMRIVIDALDVQFRIPGITHIVVVSGDSDFSALMQRAKEYGKTVIGIGVREDTAPYLINACDAFIFYDTLVATAGAGTSAGSGGLGLTEARELLLRALKPLEEEGRNIASVLKARMGQLDPRFDEQDYGYADFVEFLHAQSDLVEVIHSPGIGDTVVRQRLGAAAPMGAKYPWTAASAPPPPQPLNPQAVAEQYRELLQTRQRPIYLAPHRERALIIEALYDIFAEHAAKHEPVTLTQVKEELASRLEQKHPFIRWQHILNVLYQLFWTFCFDFDKDGVYPEGTQLWDRKTWINPTLRSKDDLQRHSEEQLLRMISRVVHRLNLQAATCLLFDGDSTPERQAYVRGLLPEEEWEM